MYGFEIRKDPIEFIINVETDQTVKGGMVSYIEMDSVFVESKYSPGEEIKLVITEDHRKLVANEVFYHTAGFKFEAKRNHSYYLRMTRTGRDKLIHMEMENYLPLGSSGHVITPEHMGVHEAKTKHVKDKLTVTVYLYEDLPHDLRA
jgi:hypothetical protein